MNKQFIKKNSNLLIILFFVIAIILQFTLNSKKENNTKSSDKVEVVPQVLTENKNLYSYTEELNYYGVSEPLQYSDIVSSKNGRIIEINIQNGDYVEKNDILLKIENNGLNEKIESLKSKIKELKIQKESSKQLLKQELISESEYITVDSNLQQALSDLAITKKEFENTIIKAPFSGYINDFDQENGDLIANGNNIASISNLDAIKVTVKIPEVDIFKIKNNSQAKIHYNNEILKGTVNHIENVGSKETQTFDVEIVSEKLPNLISGITTKVTLYGNTYNVFEIPMHTIVLTEKGTVIRSVDKNSKVQDIPVDIITGDKNVIVKPKDNINLTSINLITSGMYKVTNNQYVKNKEVN
tara:strand:+ start:10181 stop:11248 length:1068 start_codon:yes stop_codon:yes gene_type:complete